MKKILLLIFTLTLVGRMGFAQQDPLYTQFMTNPYLTNPALAGTYPYYQIITNNRLQWVGMSDAPMTNFISMYGPTVSQPMGLGGFFVHDVANAFSTTSFNVSYAYNYSFAEDLKLSMGLALGISQYKFDGTKVTMKEQDQVFIEGEIYQNYKPNGVLGLYLWSSVYNVGLSFTNLFGGKLKFEETDTTTLASRLKQHFYLHGGYKYYITRELNIEPTVIFKKVGASPLQMDLNVRAWYGKRQWDNNKLWGGVSYRTGDAVTVLVGFLYQKKIEIGYSYDFGINKLRTFNTGSHELMIGFKFNDIKEY